MKLLISSCLVGYNVKYDGKNNCLDQNLINQLKQKYQLFLVCPEVDGGLPIPRTPCEIVSNNPLKVINKNGVDKTVHFTKGANIALQTAIKNDIKLALLKSNSPSCGNQYIYDGSFESKKIKGKGVTTTLLEQFNIKVYNEKQIEELL